MFLNDSSHQSKESWSILKDVGRYSKVILSVFGSNSGFCFVFFIFALNCTSLPTKEFYSVPVWTQIIQFLIGLITDQSYQSDLLIQEHLCLSSINKLLIIFLRRVCQIPHTWMALFLQLRHWICCCSQEVIVINFSFWYDALTAIQ